MATTVTVPTADPSTIFNSTLLGQLQSAGSLSAAWDILLANGIDPNSPATGLNGQPVVDTTTGKPIANNPATGQPYTFWDLATSTAIPSSSGGSALTAAQLLQQQQQEQQQEQQQLNQSKQGGMSLATAIGLPTGIAATAGMVAKMANIGTASLAKIMPTLQTLGVTFLAGILQYEVFSHGVDTAENDSGGNIAKLGGLYLAAVGATMLWLTRLSSYKPSIDTNVTLYDNTGPLNGDSIGSQVNTVAHVITKAHGLFTINPSPPFTAHFFLTLGVAAAITGLVVAAGVIAGQLGSSGASVDANGQAVAAFSGAVQSWVNGIPASAVSFFTAGVTLATLGFTMSPGTLYQNFPAVNTVTLANDLSSSTGQTITPSNVTNQIYVAKGAGPKGSDEVLIVTGGLNGTSSVEALNLNGSGQLMGPNGPMTSYKAFATPTVGGVNNATITGFTMNQSALTAMQQQNGCLAIAMNPNFTPAQQQAALATCASSANHNVDPTGG